MIAKTFFLGKKIHRIGTRNLHDKKSLHESQVKDRAFFALQVAGGAIGWQLADSSSGNWGQLAEPFGILNFQAMF
jgi:hypothetical protein